MGFPKRFPAGQILQPVPDHFRTQASSPDQILSGLAEHPNAMPNVGQGVKEHGEDGVFSGSGYPHRVAAAGWAGMKEPPERDFHLYGETRGGLLENLYGKDQATQIQKRLWLDEIHPEEFNTPVLTISGPVQMGKNEPVDLPNGGYAYDHPFALASYNNRQRIIYNPLGVPRNNPRTVGTAFGVPRVQNPSSWPHEARHAIFGHRENSLFDTDLFDPELVQAAAELKHDMGNTLGSDPRGYGALTAREQLDKLESAMQDSKPWGEQTFQYGPREGLKTNFDGVRSGLQGLYQGHSEDAARLRELWLRLGKNTAPADGDSGVENPLSNLLS